MNAGICGALCCLQVAFMEQAALIIHSLGFCQGRASSHLSPDHRCMTISGVLCCLQVAFMEQAVPMLDALGFVERYAWYFLSPDQAYDGHNGLPLDTASLYLMNGSATPTGQAYSSF